MSNYYGSNIEKHSHVLPHNPAEYDLDREKHTNTLRKVGGLAIDAAFGMDMQTRGRFGRTIGALEMGSPLNALGAKINAIGQEHIDKANFELALIRMGAI